MLTDLKKVKLLGSAPTETFCVGDMVESPRLPTGNNRRRQRNSATIRYGNGKYDVGNALDLLMTTTAHNDLNKAENSLRKATADEGEHRERAMNLISQAITATPKRH